VKEEERKEVVEEEAKTYRGIPPKDLCFNFVMRYWTSVNHVLKPIIPCTIASGSSILYISSCMRPEAEIQLILGRVEGFM
jgi:hypothetical protein